MKTHTTKIIWLLLPCLLLSLATCSQEPRYAAKQTPIPSIFDSAKIHNYYELIGFFPELELPFPVLQTKYRHGVAIPSFPSNMIRYDEKHPELRIPFSIANSWLFLETQKIHARLLREDMVRVTAVGKITRDEYVILIYNVAKWFGNNERLNENGEIYIDSLFFTEFRIASRDKETNMPCGNHLFGYETMELASDYACAEILPDLTVNVYQNPNSFGPKAKKKCRVDYHVDFDRFGFMEAKHKRYCEADTQKPAEIISLFSVLR